MLRIAERELEPGPSALLAELQVEVDQAGNYPAQVMAAQAAWDQKTSTVAKSSAFRIIRQTLARMCVGPVRCAYCEDSLADEIEHVRPKTLFPEMTFSWPNYLYACGPCNGPKNNRYAIVEREMLVEFIRRRGGPIGPPPKGVPALIDPRTEDPLNYLDLDLGGVTHEGLRLRGTFEVLPAYDLAPSDLRRAEFTISVLGLNREVTRVARMNAFGGFRARLREYVQEKESGVSQQRLNHLKDDLLGTPHLTVFAEMRRQRALLPDVEDWFVRAPETFDWPLLPLPPPTRLRLDVTNRRAPRPAPYGTRNY